MKKSKERTMIVLNVTYKCKPGMRDMFLANIIAEGLDRKCREEDGNIKYDYYVPTDGSNDLLLVEKWRDAEVLAVHGQQDHFRKIGEIKTDYVDDTVIERYFVED